MLLLKLNPVMLAAYDTSINGNGIVHLLLVVLIVAVCCLLIWWVGRWVMTKLAAPAVAMTVWDGLFIFIGLIVVINFLLGLIGKSFIQMALPYARIG